MRALFLMSCLCLAFIASNSFAHEHEMPMAKTSKEFDQLKKLVGTWESKTKMNGQEETITTTYELTSGGTAILERFAVGTPHEMVSVYHSDGKTVAMTHYCIMGNQPKMTLQKAGDSGLSFAMKGASGISSTKEPHMHSLNIKWNGKDKMTEEWTSFVNGKQKDTATFNFSKKI
jgi:hypothetical protein